MSGLPRNAGLARRRRSPVRVVAWLVAWAVLTAAGGQTAEEPPAKPDEPRRTDLVERTGRRLAQIDVTVRGPAEVIATLEREDFELVVGGRPFDDFIVDRLCGDAPAPEARIAELELGKTRETPAPVSPPVPARPPVTYLFYFDLQHLTMAGWNGAVQMAREFMPALVRDGDRGLFVASGKELTTYADLTYDSAELLEGLARLEEAEDWDPYAELEGRRVEEVTEALDLGIDHGLAVARFQQRQEVFHTGKALRRFAMVLGRMASLDAPKVALYFADTMRKNAGEHYTALFSSGVRNNPDNSTMQEIESEAFGAAHPYERVVDVAAAHGVRLYTIHAQGLRAENTASGSRRVRDAENGLRGLALETGGRAFVGGYRPKRVIAEIREDLSCLYLISFDPAGLPEDAPLPVRVRMLRPDVEVVARGRLVLESESARTTSRLMAAFGAPNSLGGGGAINGALIPIAFEDGRFRALLQIHVPGVPVNAAEWDLGATVLSGGKILEETSRRVKVSGPGVPIILETETRFRPGPWSVVSVAHESTTDETASRETRGEWPDPRDAPASVTSISVVQPDDGVFVRGEAVRSSGPRAIPADELLRTDLPTVFIGLVCWDKLQKKTLELSRKLTGTDSAPFPPIEIEPSDDRCASFRDIVQAGTMTSGTFSYDVSVRAGGREVASAERAFSAAEPATGG